MRKMTHQERQLRQFIRNAALSALTESDRRGRLTEAGSPVAAGQEMGVKPITLVVLYGPPAAGKGAAQKDVPGFAGVKSDKDYGQFLKDAAGAFDQEEDAAMVNFTTKTLPRSVFKSLFDRVEGGEKFEDIVSEYFHVNETGKKFELSKILAPSAFEKMRVKGRDAGAEEFAKFKNTEAYFTQARGFSDPGLPDLPGDFESALGPNDGSPTIGARLGAAARYIDDVKADLKSIVGNPTSQIESPFSTIYLADQAGESTANVGRIKALGELKKSGEFPALKIVGVFIYQPAERTKITNLHRAATGGRRVAQKEVDRIFNASPKIEGGKVVENGPAIDAMLASGFDQVHVYFPPNPLDPEKTVAPDGRPLDDAICEPLGDGTGALDIEGCEDAGPQTDAKSLVGMEQLALKKAEVAPGEGGGIPAELSDTDKEKLVAALGEMGFKVNSSQLSDYLKNVAPPGIRGGGKNGKMPWAGPIFGEKGRDPTQKVTLKGESNARGGNVLVERWQRLAGIIK